MLANVADLGLNDNLLELETQGFTVLRQALTADQVERAKTAILARVQRQTGYAVDPDKASADDYRGMLYQHYLIFEDPVFQEILLQARPLALMHYLLGESCVLSSMGSHFRGPGGLPLAMHADGSSVGMTETSLVANCNYALTPYNADNGALILVPGSHRRNRQPTARENWRAGQQSIFDVMAAQPTAEELDAITWTPRAAPPPWTLLWAMRSFGMAIHGTVDGGAMLWVLASIWRPIFVGRISRPKNAAETIAILRCSSATLMIPDLPN